MFCPHDGTPLVQEFDDEVDEEAGTAIYTGRDAHAPGHGPAPADGGAPPLPGAPEGGPDRVDRRAATVRLSPGTATPPERPVARTVPEAADAVGAPGPHLPDAAAVWALDEATEILPESTPQTGRGPIRPGDRVGGYEIVGVLGHGGMTTVYAALQPGTGRRVAVKVLHGAYASKGDHLERFLQEARAVNRVGSDRVVPVFDLGRLPDGRAYLVMEQVDGQPLDALLRQGGTLATTQAHTLFGDVASALAAAHAAGIVHRDVKPANILVQIDAQGRFRARVVDFGVAKLLGPEGARGVRTAQGMMIGTPAYMAPEQIRGKPADQRTDVYGFGVTMFQALTGELPFPETDGVDVVMQHLKWVPRIPSVLRDGLSRQWDELVLRCLEKDPARRPQSMVEVRAALAQIGARPDRGGTGCRTAVAWDGSPLGTGAAPAVPPPSQGPAAAAGAGARKAAWTALAFALALAGAALLALLIWKG